MSGTFSAGELSSFIGAQEAHLSDICTIYTYNGNTTGTDGQLSPYYLTGTYSCGFLSVKQGKEYRGQLIIPEYDAELRISNTVNLDSRSLVSYNSFVYTIDALHRGRTANIYALRQQDI